MSSVIYIWTIDPKGWDGHKIEFYLLVILKISVPLPIEMLKYCSFKRKFWSVVWGWWFLTDITSSWFAMLIRQGHGSLLYQICRGLIFLVRLRLCASYGAKSDHSLTFYKINNPSLVSQQWLFKLLKLTCFYLTKAALNIFHVLCHRARTFLGSSREKTHKIINCFSFT